MKLTYRKVLIETIIIFAMLKLSQLETLHAVAERYREDPKVPVRKLHKYCSHYKNRNSTSRLIEYAKEQKILVGPSIWCNTGVGIEIYRNLDDPLLFLEKESINPIMSKIMALIGDFSAIAFRRDMDNLTYAEAVRPSFPAFKSVDALTLNKEGELPEDRYPYHWDDLDWSVYNAMRNPSMSYVRVGSRLSVSWHTVKNRFEKISKDFKVWIAFFPKGYDFYQQSILIFKTKYEIGLREELQKLDRTSLLYKFGDSILLHLFLDYTLENLVFYKLKRKGIIHDLHVLIPIGWHGQD